MCKIAHRAEIIEMDNTVQEMEILLAELNEKLRLSNACNRALADYGVAGRTILDGILQFKLKFAVARENERREKCGASALGAEDLNLFIHQEFSPELAHHIVRMRDEDAEQTRHWS